MSLYHRLSERGVSLCTWHIDGHKAVTLELNQKYAIFMDLDKIDSLAGEMVVLAHEGATYPLAQLIESAAGMTLSKSVEMGPYKRLSKKMSWTQQSPANAQIYGHLQNILMSQRILCARRSAGIRMGTWQLSFIFSDHAAG